jgi:acyl-CoA hydrolase
VVAKFVDTALEAVQALGSGEFIWCHSMAATPAVLLDALAAHARSLQDVTIMQLHLEHAESIADPALEGHLRNRCFFAGKSTRQLINEGRADYVPMFLSEIPKLFRRGDQQVDTALVQVSTPDQHGNNSNKKIGRGSVVTGFTMGSERLYRFVDDNPQVRFLDIEFVNNPVIIAKNPQVTSINSALQIDLTGQVCADSMGHKIYSGVGGQVDFVLGSTFSEQGKSIIALPSTARKGTLSRLVPALERGAGVVTTRALVDYVVTEYGIAELRGRSIAERARDLINIAHPDFREGLACEARDVLGLRI